MNNEIKVENWNGYDIRFVLHEGKWWAVLADVCKPLGLRTFHIKERLEGDLVSTDTIPDRFVLHEGKWWAVLSDNCVS